MAFDGVVRVAVSTVNDGTLRIVRGGDNTRAVTHRRDFLKNSAIDPAQTALVPVTYQTTDFIKYREVAATDPGVLGDYTSVYADGVVTNKLGQALFLPLADCTGVVLFDPKTRTLMLSHLGRHNVEQYGGIKSVEYMATRYGVQPEDVSVWLGPSVGAATYPLWAFEGASLKDVIVSQLIEAGVAVKNIVVSPIDTASDELYYSHSEFLKGNRTEDGRFAVVAMMTEQGEPASL